MPELICELIISLDGSARGQRSPRYFGPDFADWIKTNIAVPHNTPHRDILKNDSV